MFRFINRKDSHDKIDNSGQKHYPTAEVNLSGLSENTPSSADLDSKILYEAEVNYSKIVEKVIEISKEQLEEEGKKKRELRSSFTRFFLVLLPPNLLRF